jgi:hypothetical protein
MRTTTVLFVALLCAEVSAQDVVVYPNPAGETVTVAVSDSSSAVVTIYDMTGQAVRTLEVTHDLKVEFDLHKVPTGRYLVSWADMRGTRIRVERLEIDH